jgi:Protein of unknown function (DUF1186)/SEC-C motif
MHVISNDAALAHWQALNRLPVATLNLLKTRFLREQSILASIVLPLADGLVTGLDGQEKLRDEDDPKLADFWRLATTGAIMNEILRREAGRPLRRLGDEEVNAVADETIALFEQLDASKPGEERRSPNVFTTSAQRNLLGGAAVAHCAEIERGGQEVFREVLTLRILVEALHRACGDKPATTPGTWDAERIQFALATQGDPMRREALAAADGFRADLAKDFIKELEWWADDPKEALAEDGSLGTHGLFLLGKWREESAWPVFRKLFSLPGDIGYDLLGDLITEEGSILLAMVGGSRRHELREMVEDEKLDEYCRNACLDALTCLVAWGEMPHEEHVAYLRELLTGKLHDVAANEHVFAGVVSAACDLEAWELRPEVEAAFARGVVDDGFIDLEFFLEAQAGKHRSQWQEFCGCHQPVADVAAATKWLDEPPKDEPPLSEEEDSKVIADSAQPYIAPQKVGRNEPCPCGSGKKYKKCCGK